MISYLRSIIRDSGRGRQGIGVELFRLDAAADEGVELTDEEVEEAAEEEHSTTAIMRIYEEIGEDFWTGNGMTVRKFSDQLEELGKIKRLNIHINSLGGDTHTAQAIHSIISEFEAHKTSYIDGVAASAATVVACGADEVIARFNTNYMIHNPWSIVVGSSEALREAAEALDKITVPIVAVYKQQVKGKVSEDKIKELMAAETWMTAEEARDYGFVDKVRGKIKAISKADRAHLCAAGRVMNFAKYQYRNMPKYPLVPRKVEPKGKETMADNATQAPPASALTVEVLTKDHPQLVAQLLQGERDRLSALDAMMAPGLEAIIANAKSSGKSPNDIALECFNITRTNLAQNANLSALKKDANLAGGVPASDAPVTAPAQSKQQRNVSVMQAAIKADRTQQRLGRMAANNGRN
jgi:ATP-dependent Clp protease, protease subunit